MPQKIYALILAGGSGERFWPLSRKAKPKQLLTLFSDQTLLEDTVTRLSGLVEPENILILTNEDQEAAVRALMKTSSPSQRSATRRPPSRWAWGGFRSGTAPRR